MENKNKKSLKIRGDRLLLVLNVIACLSAEETSHDSLFGDSDQVLKASGLSESDLVMGALDGIANLLGPLRYVIAQNDVVMRDCVFEIGGLCDELCARSYLKPKELSRIENLFSAIASSKLTEADFKGVE